MPKTFESAHLETPPHARWVDAVLIACLVAWFCGLIALGLRFSESPDQTRSLSLEFWALPYYAFLSLSRGFVAYLFSLIFTLIYASIAARNAKAERWMIPLIDILQSTPVLGFLPWLVLGLGRLFPHSNVGLELACILMIFTGQVWNLTFSLYYSLKSVPDEFREVSKVYRFSKWLNFTRVELPFAATGLVWNSMMSIAGGWFFLTINEAFVLGDKDFRLPGIGSYMSQAVQEQNWIAFTAGFSTMALLIFFLDRLVWKPLSIWVKRFQPEIGAVMNHESSWVLKILRRSFLIRRFLAFLNQNLLRFESKRNKALLNKNPARKKRSKLPGQVFSVLFFGVCASLVFKSVAFLAEFKLSDLFEIFLGMGFTFLRVLGSLAIASAWTIPVGIWIGSNPKLSSKLRPVIQMFASFPAPMLFPVFVLAFKSFGISLGIGSIFLILLGTQWYILFNVMAGVETLSEELKNVTQIYRIRGWLKWKTLILPPLIPFIVTGWVSAAGGAWNASIVAEYVHIGSSIETARGLGALISLATEREQFAVLAVAVILMAFFVVAWNRLVWKTIYQRVKG